MIRRIMTAIFFTCAFMACDQKSSSEEILFVCTHGAARSPIAAAYFNKLAEANNLNYHAVFRGTEPNQELTKQTIIGLTADGFEIGDWKPVAVSSQDVDKAYKIVTFDCEVPSKKASTSQVAWNGTPSISKDYNAARNAIKENVEQLIVSLKKE